MDSALANRLAADALLVAHAAFVVFVIAGLVLVLLGGACRWRWVRNRCFRLVHVAAIGVVVLQSWLGIVCPLTTLEMALRARAGDATYAGGFLAHWVQRLVYYDAPAWSFAAGYSAFGLLVGLAWWRVPPRSRHRGASR